MSTIPAARAAREVRPNVALVGALAGAKLNGLPAYRIADAVGISASMLSQVARGRAHASGDVAHAIAAALGRDVDELFPEL